jgi:hypothetical protein
MEASQAESSRGPAAEWRLAFLIWAFLGAVAVVVLILVGASLLTGINGPECHGEFPVCTTPSQQSARQSFAVFCGLGMFAYLVAAPSAVKAGRFNWSHLVIGAVIALAVLALVIDPASHLRSEAGSDQWFVASWPL